MTNIIINGDSLIELSNIKDNSIDLIFADPPYNLQLKNDLHRTDGSIIDAVNDDWDKFDSFEEYDKFTFDWLSKCYKVLSKDGCIWVIGSYHNIFRVGKIMQDIGYWILNDVVWIKHNPMPNFNGKRLCNAHETIIWAAKSKQSKFTFNYKEIKSCNEDKQLRSDWYYPICSGDERLKENGKKVHSTQKPESLLRRIIITNSKKGDLVLDPFSGSGTTCAVAKKFQRNYIGIEKDENYYKNSIDRLNKVEPYCDLYLECDLDKPIKKLPFYVLVDNDIIPVGQCLYNKDRSKRCLVLSGGIVRHLDEEGSIHKIGAYCEGKQSCNGWQYWYYEGVILDEIRKKYLENDGEEFS